MKKIISFLFLLTLVILSCSDGDDPAPVVEDPAIMLNESKADFTNEGGAKTISFETNKSWTAKSDATWCTLSPISGGASTKSITITVVANDTYDDRSCNVTITVSSLSETIAVNQGEGLGILVSDNDKTHTLSNKATTIEVEVKANVEFDVVIADDWISKVDTRGLSPTKLKFNIAENTSYDNREGAITIKQTDGDLKSVITVHQSQQNAIILSEKTHDISSENQTLTVELQTNVEFEVIIVHEAQSWVSYTETRALTTKTMVLNISENESSDERVARVFIKDKATALQDTVIIKQYGKGVYFVKQMGTLGEMLNQTQKDTITSMIIKGEINKADFGVISSRIPNLEYLDLTDVKCEGDRIPTMAFAYNKSITTMLFPESVRIVGEMAFEDNSGLKTLNLPNGLKIIERQAFYNCSGLTGSLYLPNSLTEIGEGAFVKCTGLTGSLVIPEGVSIIENTVFYQCSGFTGLELPSSLTTIGYRAFGSCSGFTGSLELPKGLTEIEERAFSNCSKFTGSLILPESLKEIGEYAFSSCHGFNGLLVFPERIETIKKGAFLGCSGFTGELILPQSITMLEEQVFYGCSGFIGTLKMPANLTTIGNRAFYNCFGFNGSLIIQDKVESIGREAFYGCSGFTGSLTLSNSLTMIAVDTFGDCSGFTGSLTIPASVTTIEKGAFSNCFGFNGSLNIPGGLTDIGNAAFVNCKNITGKVIFPITLTSLGASAFELCHKVEAFRFPHTEPIPYNYYVFSKDATVEVPILAVETYKATDGWKGFNIVGY